MHASNNSNSKSKIPQLTSIHVVLHTNSSHRIISPLESILSCPPLITHPPFTKLKQPAFCTAHTAYADTYYTASTSERDIWSPYSDNISLPQWCRRWVRIKRVEGGLTARRERKVISEESKQREGGRENVQCRPSMTSWWMIRRMVRGR
jgi:hypothetical protein